MTTQSILWTSTTTAAVVALVAALAERRRARRRDIDRVGWVPWTLVQVIAMGISAVTLAYAIKL